MPLYEYLCPCCDGDPESEKEGNFKFTKRVPVEARDDEQPCPVCACTGRRIMSLVPWVHLEPVKQRARMMRKSGNVF